MSRSRILFFLASLVVLTSLTGGRWFADAVRSDEGEDSLYKHLSTFTEVLDLVRRAYVDETELEALMVGALDGTTDALDPFSVYVPAAQVDPFLAAQRVGSRHSGLTLLKERGIVYVLSVADGSPAAAADVRAGDVVTTIDGGSTRLMPLWEVQELLAREAGTEVHMDLLRRGEESEATFTLGPFESPAASLAEVGEGEERAPLLRIPRFDAGTVGEVEALLRRAEAEGEEGILVDLRDTAEGDAALAYQVGGLFASGELGRLIKRDAALEVFREDAAPRWDGRLVVLVNRGTVGAAEVLASILRQKAGGELVGETTFGHAGRLDAADLSTGGRLLYTDAFFAGPDGAPLDEGLEPDQVVDFSSRGFGEAEVPLADLILRRGIERLLEAGEPEVVLPEAA
jgi:carboxyl-terminal processing protease